MLIVARRTLGFTVVPGYSAIKRPNTPINTYVITRIHASAVNEGAPRLTRVVTDIDDTVKSSGNKRLVGIPLGGIDAQYRRGEFYPGVFQFNFELATHALAGQMPLPVAVLTARAKEFLFALELDKEHPISLAFRRCGMENGCIGWGLGPVLYGSVKEWVFYFRKGRRKFKNFKMLLEQDDVTRGRVGLITEYIFIGDTGEADSDAGVKMCQSFPGELRALFMHSVSCDEDYCPVPDDYIVNGVPVMFFKTYVGAAAKAYTVGLLTEAAVRRVIKRAMLDLKESDVPRDSSKWEDLEWDIEQAEMAFAGQAPPIQRILV